MKFFNLLFALATSVSAGIRIERSDGSIVEAKDWEEGSIFTKILLYQKFIRS
jgi:hypothetical protein